jgi:hypothetical protein
VWPAPRGVSCYTVNKARTKLYLFGGNIRLINGPGGADLWEYNAVNKTWTWLFGNSSWQTAFSPHFEVIGDPNPNTFVGSRLGCGMVMDDQDHLWLFGGQTALSSYNDDLWMWDGEYWTFVTGTTNIYNNSTLSNGIGHYGTIGQSAATNLPPARTLHCMWYWNNTLYIFGGQSIKPSQDYIYFNDMWSYTTQDKWIWLGGSSAANDPGNDTWPVAICSSAYAFDDVKGQLWMWSGRTQTGKFII